MFIQKIFNYSKENWSSVFFYRHLMRSIESIAVLLIQTSFLILSFNAVKFPEMSHFVPNLVTFSIIGLIYSFYRSISQEYRALDRS